MADKDLLYQVVAARRLQWDNLVWQSPVLSLTAQAFLFTIALGGEVSQLARILASFLSMVIAILSIHLMAKHRLGEITDARWLEEYERERWPGAEVHGHAFRLRRAAMTDVGSHAKWNSYRVWSIGMGLFGAVGLIVFFLSIFGVQALDWAK